MSVNVSGYLVHIYAGKNGNPNAPQAAPGERAMVVLFDTGTPPKTVAYLHFWDTGANVPADQTQGTIHVGNLPWVAFDSVVDLLRNEKPIVWASVSGGSFGDLSTGQMEPVGKGGA